MPEGPGVPLIQKTQSLRDILFKYVLGKFYFIIFQRGLAIKVYLLVKGGPKKESEMSSKSNGIGKLDYLRHLRLKLQLRGRQLLYNIIIVHLTGDKKIIRENAMSLLLTKG